MVAANLALLLPVCQIKHLDRLRPSSHRMGIVRQGDDRVLVASQLGDEPHFNALRLQGGNKGVPRAVGGHGGEAELLDGGSPEALAEIVVD